MRKISIKNSILFLLLALSVACSKDDSAPADPNAWTDAEGHTYKTVKIGDQIWMAENLRTKKASDGSSLGELYTHSSGSVDTIGYQYNHDQALAACPKGWHLPTDEEWQTLERFIGMPENEISTFNAFRGESANSGKKLKSTDAKSQTCWTSESTYAGTDQYGFNAFAGDYYTLPIYMKKATVRNAMFFSATMYNPSLIIVRFFKDNQNGISRLAVDDYIYYCSVRYVRDSDSNSKK